MLLDSNILIYSAERRLYLWEERRGAGAKKFALKTRSNPSGGAED